MQWFLIIESGMMDKMVYHAPFMNRIHACISYPYHIVLFSLNIEIGFHGGHLLVGRKENLRFAITTEHNRSFRWRTVELFQVETVN